MFRSYNITVFVFCPTVVNQGRKLRMCLVIGLMQKTKIVTALYVRHTCCSTRGKILGLFDSRSTVGEAPLCEDLEGWRQGVLQP